MESLSDLFRLILASALWNHWSLFHVNSEHCVLFFFLKLSDDWTYHLISPDQLVNKEQFKYPSGIAVKWNVS